jgi:hypothetical protein
MELLENTKLVYKPKYTLKDVQVYLNNTIYNTLAIIKPTVTLYVNEFITDESENNEIIRRLNVLLQQAIVKFNNRLKMVDYILEKIDDDKVQYVKIDNLDTIGELNTYNFVEGSNRFIVSKKLAINKDSFYVPQLDFTLKIVKV